ncbi:DUF4097 family beta strand repeat-containing protein [Nocardiopsis sp. N85]|uniref:DUF4097 family beta strand repeat-containing protein n=1 Tax=Nocardiopsis sp. N85 TaxID=3029400 RepID=UPI00237F95C7|nr:DUF4097 family beta strand repeat-containing protein [Nocardiopsis sp. N85]MDE3722064.1 DUF4097 family beta strand repeat-containing protein [Nocardiopsis sp. N85]
MTFKARGLYASSSKEPGSGFRTGPWLLLGGALVVVLVVVTVFSALGNVGLNRGERGDSFAAPERVVIENETGGEVRLSGTDAPEVRVDRSLRGTPFNEPDDEIELDGGELTIDAECSGLWFVGDCAVDYDIAVPAGVSVEVQNHRGMIVATGIDGDVRAETLSGRVEVEGITGSADLETVSGSIVATGTGERLSAVSVSGRIDVSGFDAETVEAESVSGSVSVGDGFTTAEVSTTSGGIDVSTDTRFETLAVESTSGSVDVRVPEGAYDVTGSSVSGGRDIGVDASASGPRVQVDTISGGVTVRSG